ncbi:MULTISPECIES: SRPBCC domain-containing protein [Niastella]|uniref:SRPBCC domain-containing protein n=1 Tax=Niastella soli TaxID=2821487 RepID=A0ABS3YNC5_9BACT|nr:SRPBCC domain-containing protein [Niastella soli]MBO9199402.1 SRPBCC domain-containing protein [Niastella soli]
MNKRPMITVTVEIYAPMENIWKNWNTPKDIQKWNNINNDWHTPVVENDCRAGGKFLYRMGTKDGSLHFDFTGQYDIVTEHELIAYTLDSGRTATITFSQGYPVIITETFEPGEEPSIEEQRNFCQAILNSFKNYVEQ